MDWSKKLIQLNDVLGALVPNKENIPKYIQASGLREQFVNTSGNALDVWHSVLGEAQKHEKVDDLVNVVLDHYPNNPFLQAALKPVQVDYALSDAADEITEWQPVDEETLEVLTMGKSTLLPISFLAQGVKRSKSVAKIEIKVSTQKVDVGTGFLFKIEGSDEVFFITNYHVLNDRELIDQTRIIFNFELDINGDAIQSKSFKIDEDGPWYLSPVDQFDICVCKLLDPTLQLQQFEFLELRKIEVFKNEFVNVIQHPGGQMKQISLFHNIVTNVDGKKIQYLTDTLKGSSGSPVFNRDWDVVAIHHSGSNKKPGEPDLPVGVRSRNEGIWINEIIDFITSKK
jgi:V8-like Glu-specific endopeptidase